MSETRGSWNMMRAIKTAWDAASLDASFQAYWTTSSSDYEKWTPLNFQDPASAAIPGPYCVFEVVSPSITGHSSGKTRTTIQQYQRHIVRFHVHAKNQTVDGTQKSALEIALTLATLIAAAFDPVNDPLSLSPDAEINVIRGPDYPVPLAETEAKWVLEYEIEVDCTYDS